MLMVRTFVDKSTIPNAGLGCFAAEDIVAGAKIWELNPLIDRIYTEESMQAFTEIQRQFIETYAYKHHGLYFLCVDNGRFFNHSEYPNTCESTGYATFAARDIKTGEELLSDYSRFGSTEDDRQFNKLN